MPTQFTPLDMNATLYRQGPDIKAEIVYHATFDASMTADDVVTDILNGQGLAPGNYALLLVVGGLTPGVYMFVVGTV